LPKSSDTIRPGLAPVGIVSTIVQAVIVKKDLPVKSMAELVSRTRRPIRQAQLRLQRLSAA
jgi:tripartite-type tricarboxylate transporter receptor subunit TctC